MNRMTIELQKGFNTVLKSYIWTYKFMLGIIAVTHQLYLINEIASIHFNCISSVSFEGLKKIKLNIGCIFEEHQSVSLSVSETI